MEPTTHRAIDRRLCGHPAELREGFARLQMRASKRMRADANGLIHGGFVFGLADHAAMLAVNHPNVVLGTAQMRFLKPVKVGDELTAEAVLHDQEGNRKIVTVDVHRADEVVARGEMICFTPEHHVLQGSE